VSEALPVTIIGGYLGAGKTTMVNHLLRTANGQRLAILVNEFGELPIDEDLIEAQDEDIISIAGGCVCCSFGSDLTGALLEMAQLKPRPDHLIIESSGVAIPSAIAGSISLLEAYRVDGIVVLADAETVQQSATDKYMSDTVMRQITDANILILNKTDLVAEGALAQTFDWLKAQNPGVRVVTAQQGVVAPQIVLGSFLERAARTVSSYREHGNAHTGGPCPNGCSCAGPTVGRDRRGAGACQGVRDLTLRAKAVDPSGWEPLGGE
jgi:G3E family GTPase